MKCPTCPSEVWALYICEDGTYRCWQCKAAGRGRVIVRKPQFVVTPTPEAERIERLYISRRRK